ncbi:tryptophan synthase subunit alpha [Sphingomonas daechungensis]|uniref:Tryptophan synthase alpha chain n=1 Tax=Sphingomonas daechungensis TaxID=1176646 RepID=A0ABX6T2J4_9SPHN|nr:tryptophan synthase subunit alpha [Sphingomonas daechungensis]QNP43453.1 tryptophan synthase subunit alpha [Sphingomonas daechungensis]
MSRYDAMFDRLRGHGEAAFGGFLMLGDPDLETCARLLDAVVEGGADMIEVGIPFSDPVADGPVIQAAAVRALEAGTRVDDCFRLLTEFRSRHANIPVGILTYANLVAARGRERFFADATAAGVDSLLIADVPSLEAEPYADEARSAGVSLVMIAAPNTPGQTLTRIGRLCSGYTYCVARAGVTGERQELALEHDRLFTTLQSVGAPPAVLGFGISTPDHVRQAIASGAAGVISGSAIVRLGVEQGADAVREFVATMKAATRSTVSA